MRKQKGHIVKISGRWYVRYWERRNIGSTVEKKRVSHCLGSITTRGKHPPADIEEAAEQHMATVNGGKIPAERITTIGEFVTGVYLPWIERHKRPSSVKCDRDSWEDYRDGEIHVSHSRWNGHETEPKTAKSRAPVPVIRHLAERLEMHRLRSGNPALGPMSPTGKGTPRMMNNL